MSLPRLSPLVSPRRSAAGRPLRAGDIFNAIVPALESAGFEVEQVCEEGFLIRADDMTIVGEFRTRNTVVPPVDAPADDARWTGDDGGIDPDDDTMPVRRETRTRDVELTPEEREWKEKLAPFSRNGIDVDTLLGMRRAMANYERLLRIL